MIKNFILVHFEKKQKSEVDIWIEENIGADKNRFKVQKSFFLHMIKQIQYFYKSANIHVICKDSKHEILQNKGLILHEFPEMPTNNLSKLNAFGLLNQPAMLMDCDILMLRPFENHHLETSNPFNLYCTYNANSRNNKVTFTMYNSGIVWIKEPSRQLEIELKKNQEVYFSDSMEWFDNDEYPICKFIHDNKLKMNLHWDVNSFRGSDNGIPHKRDKEEMRRFQTIHYPATKDIFLKECQIFESERPIFI